MRYELTIVAYEKYYAKAIAQAGSNGIEFEEIRSYAGDRAVKFSLSNKQMEKLFDNLEIDESPKVRLP